MPTAFKRSAGPMLSWAFHLHRVFNFAPAQRHRGAVAPPTRFDVDVASRPEDLDASTAIPLRGGLTETELAALALTRPSLRGVLPRPQPLQ
jgi:hypothetical protein